MTLNAVGMRIMKIRKYVKSIRLLEMKITLATLRVLLSGMLKEVMGRAVMKAGRMIGLRYGLSMKWNRMLATHVHCRLRIYIL
jgi:hypothetical protein